MRTIYLDHNALTPILPEAVEAMQGAYAAFGNPSSSHHCGRRARRLLEDAREWIASLLNARPDELFFTSGATEANNLALFGLAGQSPVTLLATEMEHPCVREPLKKLAMSGHSLQLLPVSAEGLASAASFRDASGAEVSLATLMLVNHETGAIQPVRHIAKTLPKTARIHCDAAQAVGKIPVDFRDLGVTTLSFSSQKFGGPQGIGGLLVKTGIKLPPRLFGGHQQQGIRPGTEPVALVCGMAAALKKRVAERETTFQKHQQFRHQLWQTLEQTAAPVFLNGPPLGSEYSAPATLNVSFPGCRADVLLAALDLVGVAASAGAACSSGSLLPSPTLQAMNVGEERLHSAVRFSFGFTTTEDEITLGANLIAERVVALRDAR